MNHSKFCWNTRILPNIKKAFTKIWNTNELLVSYDAINVFRPYKWYPEWLTKSNWWHVDQHGLSRGYNRICVQGLVTYYDVTQETGGLCVIPKSHIYYKEISLRNDNINQIQDFVTIPMKDSLLQTYDGILIAAKAGDLILWDSRTIHCNTCAININKNDIILNHSQENNDIIRLISYVCMLPISITSKEVIESRKHGYIHSIGTTHWPNKLVSNYESDNPIDITQSSSEVLKLVGYNDYEIENKNNTNSCIIC